jgi:hypothetical protein
VSNKLLGTFADCLERTLAEDQPAPAAAADEPVTTADGPVAAAVPEPSTAPSAIRTEGQRPTPEAIDLLGTAGAPVLKRLLPAVAAVAVLVLLWRILRRIGS